jgi:hypothetical protein
MADITWDPIAEEIAYEAAAAQMLDQASQDVFQVALSIAPVKAARSTYSGGPLPGKLKASLYRNMGRDAIGPFADVRALWYGRFLDPKARQLGRLYPFLPSALRLGLAGKRYYLY